MSQVSCGNPTWLWWLDSQFTSINPHETWWFSMAGSPKTTRPPDWRSPDCHPGAASEQLRSLSEGNSGWNPRIKSSEINGHPISIHIYPTYIYIYIYLRLSEIIWVYIYIQLYIYICVYLVGGFNLPIWKIWVRQLGWWTSQYMEK